MKRIIIDHIAPGGIPAMAVYPESSERLPLVVYLHGFGSDKTSGLEYGYKLAEAGLYFVGVDCWLHGDRSNDDLSAKRFSGIYPSETGIDTYILMHEIVQRTSEEFGGLIKHFQTDPQVNVERLGVTGFSMGAFATFMIAANYSQVKAAVAIGGKPAFQKAWDDIVLGAGTYEQWRESMEALARESTERSAYMAQIDPFKKLSVFAPKPLLMINGDRDTDQPFIYSLELYRKLKPLYEEHRDCLQLSMPPIEHSLTPALLDEACQWMKKHL